MPISSRHGKWPVTYGTKIVRPGPDYRCSLCSQKHCFICEHDTPVREEVLEKEEDDLDRYYSNDDSSMIKPQANQNSTAQQPNSSRNANQPQQNQRQSQPGNQKQQQQNSKNTSNNKNVNNTNNNQKSSSCVII